MTEIQLLNRSTSVEKPGAISLKIIILWIAGIIAAFASGWFLKSSFGAANSANIILGASFIIIFLAIFLLQSFFVPDRGASIFSIVLESVAIVLPFIVKSLWVLSFMPVIFIILYIGNSRGRSTLENSLKISFWSVSKAVLPKGVVAISLLIAGLAPLYLSSAGKQEFPISPFFFRELVTPGNFLVGKFFPGFTNDATLEEIAVKASVDQLNKMPEARNLTDTAKKQIITSNVSQIYERISFYAGGNFNPKLSIPESVYEILRKKFLNLSDQTKNIIYAAIGILIFFIIEAISWPLRIVISILAFIVMEILLALGFAQTSFEQRSKEVIIT